MTTETLVMTLLASLQQQPAPPDGAPVDHLQGAIKVQNSKIHSIQLCFQLQENSFNEQHYEMHNEKFVHFVHF